MQASNNFLPFLPLFIEHNHLYTKFCYFLFQNVASLGLLLTICTVHARPSHHPRKRQLPLPGLFISTLNLLFLSEQPKGLFKIQIAFFDLATFLPKTLLQLSTSLRINSELLDKTFKTLLKPVLCLSFLPYLVQIFPSFNTPCHTSLLQLFKHFELFSLPWSYHNVSSSWNKGLLAIFSPS